MPPPPVARLDLSKLQQPYTKPCVFSAKVGLSARGPLSARLGPSPQKSSEEAQLTARILRAQEGAQKCLFNGEADQESSNDDSSMFAMHSAMEQATEAMKRTKLELADERAQKKELELRKLDLEMQVQELQEDFRCVRSKIEALMATCGTCMEPRACEEGRAETEHGDIAAGPISVASINALDEIDYDVKFDIMNQLPQEHAVLLVDFVDRLDREREKIQKEREQRHKDMKSLQEGLCKLHDACKKSCMLETGRNAGIFSAVGEPLPSFRLIHDSSKCAPPSMQCVSDLEDSLVSIDEDSKHTPRWDRDFATSLNKEGSCTRLTVWGSQSECMAGNIEIFTNAVEPVLDDSSTLRVAVTFDLSEVEVSSHTFLVMLADWCSEAAELFQPKLAVVTVILSDTYWSRAVWSCFWGLMLTAPPTACPFSVVFNLEDADQFIKTHVD